MAYSEPMFDMKKLEQMLCSVWHLNCVFSVPPPLPLFIYSICIISKMAVLLENKAKLIYSQHVLD